MSQQSTAEEAMEVASDDEEGCIRFDDIYVPPPPATAFQMNADGSRLIITQIVNENFKSYADIQPLGPFHKYFTAIIGPNGSGKSNVIDSMLFVFGYRANRLRSKKISALLHESPDHAKVNSCTVTVHFALMIDVPEDSEKYQLIAGSEFYISRTACVDNSSYYTINGKRVQFKEVGKLLRQHGIDLDHNRFLILQGEVEQISLMKPKAENEHEVGMLEYLEDIIGSSRFKEPIADLAKRVELLSEVRDEKWNRCKMAKTEMEDVRGPMEAALRYVQLENTIVMLNHKLLQKKIVQGEADKTGRLENVKKFEGKMKELVKNLEDIRKEIEEKESANSSQTKEIEKFSSYKDSAKAAFQKNKLTDLALQQDIENANKKRKETAKTLTAEEEKRIRLEKVPEKNEETISELDELEEKLERERQGFKEKLDEISATLREDTQALQDEKEALMVELAPLKRALGITRGAYDMSKKDLDLYVGQEETEKTKLADLKKRYETVTTGLQEGEQKLEEVKAAIPQKEALLKEHQQEIVKLRRDEEAIEEAKRTHELSMDEARMSIQSTRRRGKVLDSLMQQKREGKLPGIFGRMGDLGAIDEKYDVAVSTACGALDHIVVDTIQTATACLNYLKYNNIGQSTFVALEKLQKFVPMFNRPFKAPENVPRLFDLIRVADERVRPAFYFGLQDTLVAKDLDQARRLAYGSTRYRVVTLTGEIIEVAGTMTGGGNTAMRGRMGRNVVTTESASPEDLEKLERKVDEARTRLGQVRNKIGVLENQIQQVEGDLRALRQQKNQLDMDVQSFSSQLPMINSQVHNQETKLKSAALDKKKLEDLNKVVAKNQKELEKATVNVDAMETQVNKLTTDINAKVKGRMDSVEKKLNVTTEKLDKVRKEKTVLKAAIKTAKRNLKTSEDKIGRMQQDIENAVEKIKKCAEDIKKNETSAQETLADLEKCEEKLQALQEANSGARGEIDALFKKETELKAKQIDLKNELNIAKKDFEHRQQKIAADKKRLQGLKLMEEPANDEKVELRKLTDEELEEIDVDELLEDLKNKESSLPKTRPNLGAIQEYMKKQVVCLEREKDLETATTKRNSTRGVLEEFRKTRLIEFMKGFSIISTKVKECYQMLAEGGDAELELANTMDPFLDGIRFTVRPPKKSWKEMQYLSGGEKTLSSLSLIFALHYYKPTPLYFMDEIDSALDWKNTAIVGFYLKEQTKNAQFIIVSLRENMFEIADQLVGIFKTNNCTKSVTISPSEYFNGTQPDV